MSGVANPKLTPLERGRVQALPCRSCDRTLAVLGQDGMKMAVLGTFLSDDGDAIPGAAAQMAGWQVLCTASVGRCPYCSSRHWFLEVDLHEGTADDLIDAVGDDPDWRKVWVSAECCGGSVLWNASESTTTAGRFFRVAIGPMPIPTSMSSHGANGVSACGGGEFWEHAKATVVALGPEIEREVELIARQ